MSSTTSSFNKIMYQLGARYVATINGVLQYFDDVDSTVTAVLDHGTTYLASINADGSFKREIL